MNDSDFKPRARRTQYDLAAGVLIEWHNVEVFAACIAVWSVVNIGIVAFDLGLYTGHRFLPVPVPPVLSY